MKCSFFIVADRGELKAFRVEKVPADRPPRLEMVRAMDFVDAHAKIGEINTDLAGRFPSGGGNFNGKGGASGRHQNSTSERHYNVEFDRRAARQLGHIIGELLQENHVDSWSFAAPAELKSMIFNELHPDNVKTMAEFVPCDLVHVTHDELLDHFTHVRAA
jgi:hypothetical protein